MEQNKAFLNAKEIAGILRVSCSQAYTIIVELIAELEFVFISGVVINLIVGEFHGDDSNFDVIGPSIHLEIGNTEMINTHSFPIRNETSVTTGAGT